MEESYCQDAMIFMIYLIRNCRNGSLMLGGLLSFIIIWITRGKTEGGRGRIRRAGIFFVNAGRAIFLMQLPILMSRISIILRGTLWTTSKSHSESNSAVAVQNRKNRAATQSKQHY